MIALHEFIAASTERGECKCGRCIDVGSKADPSGHTADMAFYRVALKGQPTLEEFKRRTKAHVGHHLEVDPFDGREHGYIELGAWLGSQEYALRYMALGALLGAFNLLTPRSVLGADLPEELVRQAAVAGYVTVVAKGGS